MESDSVLALRTGEDARRVGLRLGSAHERFVTSHVFSSCVRAVVAGSWRRCIAASACADGSRLPPVGMDSGELDDYRSRHPLAVLLPMFRDLLGGSADDGEHIYAIADAAGTLLWVQGRPGMLSRAERMNFVEGAVWSEAQAGTNAPGTALAVARPVQIFEAEHYNAAVHLWSCSAAPIRDPQSSQVLGVVDITGGENVASPYALALVKATARAAEVELAGRMAASTPSAHLGGRLLEGTAVGRPQRAECSAVRLTALGRDNAVLEFDGRTVRLSPRHSEIVVVLALAAGGLTGDRLAVGISEEELHSSTIRAEMTRLRSVLGEGLLASRPYALRRPVTSDFVVVGDLLAEGRVHEALAAYAGPLLPSSEAPAIVEERTALEQQLRGAVLAGGDAGLLRRWVNAVWVADDACAWHSLARLLPAGSAQQAAAAARAVGLDEKFGVPLNHGTRTSSGASGWRPRRVSTRRT